MPTFHPTEPTQTDEAQPAVIEERLSPWQSALVIIVLSILSWAVLISIVMALRELL
jgi:hypothetical protein